jgi:hypothetical protein
MEPSPWGGLAGTILRREQISEMDRSRPGFGYPERQEIRQFVAALRARERVSWIQIVGECASGSNAKDHTVPAIAIEGGNVQICVSTLIDWAL